MGDKDHYALDNPTIINNVNHNIHENNASNLENVIKDKINPILDGAMEKYLGIKIPDLKNDISNNLFNSKIIDIQIDFTLNFKESKNKFKEMFLEKQLEQNYGNISLVAKLTEIDRRSIHRIVSKDKSDQIRKDLNKPYYLKQKEIEHIIEGTLNNYKEILNEKKITEMYNATELISKEITDKLPEEHITMKEAETIFEKKYLAKKLSENNFDLKTTADNIKLRYETLIRKIKTHNIKVK